MDQRRSIGGERGDQGRLERGRRVDARAGEPAEGARERGEVGVAEVRARSRGPG